MKVLHLPSTYLPDSKGGKEVFVSQLIKNLPGIQHRIVIHGAAQAMYTVDGVRVEVLPFPVSKNSRQSYFSLLFDELPGFESLLREFQPDLVHFHDFTSGASLSHLNIVKKLRIRSLVTYHSPGSSCLQRGLTFADRLPCDGKLDIIRCTSCRYQSSGFSQLMANGFARLKFSSFDQSGRLLLRNGTEMFIRSWYEFFDTVDGIHVAAKWLKQMLVSNSIEESKVHFIDLGGHQNLSHQERVKKKQTLKLVFSGRCTDIKGVHVLIDAVKLLPTDAQLEVHFFGPYWNDSEYGRKMTEKIKGDKRFIKPLNIAPDEILYELAKMDMAVIPSLWPETGPLSLFDALAAGLPIIGTRLAGIQERLVEGKTGLLFEWNDSESLATKINLVLQNPETIEEMKKHIIPNRTFEQMSSDIERLYHLLLVNDHEV